VRALGDDDRQLTAIAAGGVIRDIVESAGAVTLSQVMRSPTRPKAPSASPCATSDFELEAP
jgi:hypothetical protein